MVSQPRWDLNSFGMISSSLFVNSLQCLQQLVCLTHGRLFPDQLSLPGQYGHWSTPEGGQHWNLDLYMEANDTVKM